jgi:hypothetical protein
MLPKISTKHDARSIRLRQLGEYNSANALRDKSESEAL